MQCVAGQPKEESNGKITPTKLAKGVCCGEIRFFGLGAEGSFKMTNANLYKWLFWKFYLTPL